MTLDAIAMDLLMLLNEERVEIKDGRLNPLAMVDLKEAGLIHINVTDKMVSLTEQGRAALTGHLGGGI